MKKLLSIIFAVIMTFSALSTVAVAGSYNIEGLDFEGNPYIKAVVNGAYEFDDYTDYNNPKQYAEVGSTLTIKLPVSYISIIDTALNEGGLWYAEDNIVYFLDESGVTTDTGACTVTNMNTATYTDDYDTVITYYKPGITICFNKPGNYEIQTGGVYIPGESNGDTFWQGFTVLKKGGIAERHTARYTNSTVLVNGKATSFEAYNIGGNNYFKLRDLAMALNGTGKQFEVTWDAETGSIGLVVGQAYTPVGGELAAGNGTNKECNPSNSRLIYYAQSDNGQVPYTYVIEAKAYNINGNNYFKLRDICSALDVGVTWDAATSTIGIDTSIPYTE